MTKRNREAVQQRRQEKRVAQGRVTKPKFEEVKQEQVRNIVIVPRNDRQKAYHKSLLTNTITVGRGSAGTGKTYLAARVAAAKYLKGEVEKIVVMRPLVGMGASSGFWPGTIQDKIGPYVAPILSVLRESIGDHRYDNDFGDKIVIQPMEAVRGMSFKEKTFVIVDESQNCTPDEIRSLTTRLETGSQAVFCGDDRQKDLKGLSGIEYLCNLIKNRCIPECGVVEFTPEDIVRSGLTKIFVQIFDEEGPAPK